MSDEILELEGEPSDAIRIDLDQVDREIRGGLAGERPRLLELRKNRVYFEGDNDAEVPSRPAEDRLDYDARPKQVSFMTRKVVRNLTRYTYCPGPTRKLEGEGASKWLEQVYKDNGLNELWADADREATLQGVCAFQVAATGDPRRPVRVHLWKAEELAVWCPSDDAINPQAVCTITSEGPETVYTRYTAADVQRYKSNKSAWGADRATILPDGDPVPNPYGRLPFAWVHFERPTSRFWTPGLGKLVRKVNARVDEKMSELAEAQRFYLKPVGMASGVPPGWRPKIRPGGFNVIPYRPGANGAPATEPKVWYLQAEVNVTAAWADIDKTIETGLSDLDVPLAAYRADTSGTASAAAMVAEQMPLLKYARVRRHYYAGPEGELARLVAAIGCEYYEWEAGLKAQLAAEADDPKLVLGWPDDLRVPWMEASQVQTSDIEEGLTSRVKVLMLERGLSREDAERELAENVADEALYRQLQAEAGIPPDPAKDPTAAGGGDPPADPDGGSDPGGSVAESPDPGATDDDTGRATSPGQP